jgi:phosphocarrier protein
MIKKEFVLKNPLGFHARPATKFVQACQRYSSKVRVIYQGREVEGRSLIGLLSLAIPPEEKFWVQVEGPDEEALFHSLKELIESGFGEI